jgi:hypothetical protein
MIHKISRVVFLFFSVVVLVGALASTGCKRPGIGYNTGYEPEQPIPFDHSLHAGKYKINCQYCHTGVERAAQASVPSLNICMNCHIQVKTQSDVIKELGKTYRAGGSIEWIKVHMLPDFAKFNHQRHVNAGKNCTECHGAVETMSVVRQVSDLSMGMCIECHRRPEHNASQNCTTCHH